MIPLKDYMIDKGILTKNGFLAGPFLYDPYPRFGLTRIRVGDRWVVTHPDGDEVADKILSGEIPAEEAERMATKRRRYALQMANPVGSLIERFENSPSPRMSKMFRTR